MGSESSWGGRAYQYGFVGASNLDKCRQDNRRERKGSVGASESSPRVYRRALRITRCRSSARVEVSEDKETGREGVSYMACLIVCVM